MASKRIAKKNALIKNLESVETLGSTNVICTDKTGTLTQNRISVHRIMTPPDKTYCFGIGDDDTVGYGTQLQYLRRIMALNNNATPSNSTGSGYVGDSTEAALLACVRDMGDAEDLKGFVRVKEKPFTSESKFMITVHQVPSMNDDDDHDYNNNNKTYYEAYLKGAPEVIFAFCDKIMMGGEAIPIDDVNKGWLNNALTVMASTGERCLGLAYYRDCCCDDDDNNNDGGNYNNNIEIPKSGYTFCGIAGMLDPPRPEVPAALKKCRDAGIRVFMLTGDYGLTARTIAKAIGLFTSSEDDNDDESKHEDEIADDDDDLESGPPTASSSRRRRRSRVVEGPELLQMSEEELSICLDIPELVFARISPIQKLQIVQALQSKGQVVTVTGDGVNDAPALKNADMGVSMGIMGTDVAKEASNMILMDDNFATIVGAVEEGRTIFDNIKKFIAYVLTSNIPEITPFIAYVLLSIPLPLTVVLILAIDLGTDIVPSLALGAESAEIDVMKQKPRSKSERLLTRNMLGMSYGIVGMTQAISGFCSYFVVLKHGGWVWGEELSSNDPLYRTSITAFFASIIICQIADVLICRTRRQSLFVVGIFSNPLIFVGIATELSLLFLISYVPILNKFFGTAPLQWWHMMLSIPFAIAIVIGDEIRRYFVRNENKFVLKWLTW